MSKGLSSENKNKKGSDGHHQHVLKPNQTDVLCGRGKFAQLWHGNAFYRDLVHRNKLEYIIGSDFEKNQIAQSVVQAVRGLDPPGRFLKLDEMENEYFDIGDKNACHKVKQSLREGSNILLAQITPCPFDKTLQNTLEDDDDYIEILSMLRNESVER